MAELIDSRSFNKKVDISSLLGKMASTDCSGEYILIKRSASDEIITPKGKGKKESSARGKALWGGGEDSFIFTWLSVFMGWISLSDIHFCVLGNRHYLHRYQGHLLLKQDNTINTSIVSTVSRQLCTSFATYHA